MPIVNDSRVNFTPYQMLYSRCATCFGILAWRAARDETTFQATCCRSIYQAEKVDSRMAFVIDVYEASPDNLVVFPPR